jgi:hypothetical protein
MDNLYKDKSHLSVKKISFWKDGNALIFRVTFTIFSPKIDANVEKIVDFRHSASKFEPIEKMEIEVNAARIINCAVDYNETDIAGAIKVLVSAIEQYLKGFLPESLFFTTDEISK